MNRILTICFVLGAFSACTTERVTTEFSALSELAQNTKKKLAQKLKPGLDAAAEAELDVSAASGDVWLLSDDCNFVMAGDTSVPASNCIVEKVVLGNRKPVQNEATSAQRKMTALTTYVSALSLLTDASLEEEVISGYSSALTALTDFAKAAESATLLEFLKDRSERESAETAVVSEVIATLRYKKMRSVVLKSEKDVATIVRELQLHLINLGIDGDFKIRSEALTTRNNAVLNYDVETQGATGYKAAIKALQAEHQAFMKYYKGTVIYEVGMIARVHSTLADALRSPGSPEEVVKYLESLKTLVEKVEG
ncbi:hypothetical protein [Parasedimentitalea psychrophila]|uniref:Lipoprotein n=1 Tax=Parasedimentitalea psychrophila TaxID=2997337 RepID=A0A9Y2P6B9_9RHOB|nr:hypothetical protein [Parasedimentitalea psychrophila]WIY24525.1 hypothetical protein QPJ95_18580 [Parasedimentitalea psychrophila]